MNCPFCNQELKERDFYNLSLGTTCPQCKKVLVFNPKMLPLLLFLFGSFYFRNAIPFFINGLIDFCVGFVVVMVLMAVFIILMIKLKMGEVGELGAKYRK